jgi:hypothetical protein
MNQIPGVALCSFTMTMSQAYYCTQAVERFKTYFLLGEYYCMQWNADINFLSFKLNLYSNTSLCFWCFISVHIYFSSRIWNQDFILLYSQLWPKPHIYSELLLCYADVIFHVICKPLACSLLIAIFPQFVPWQLHKLTCVFGITHTFSASSSIVIVLKYISSYSPWKCRRWLAILYIYWSSLFLYISFHIFSLLLA